MDLTLHDYPPPPEVSARIVELAEQADALFMGEIHGTQEVPRIVAGLLSMLYERGYRGLGVEVPHREQESLRAWISEPKNALPDFYARPWLDGRGSREMRALIRRDGQIGFHVFCFNSLMRKNALWNERDAGMAQVTYEIWQEEFPNDKVILICGNNHAFLKPPAKAGHEYWPSFAEALRQEMPEKQFQAINLMPASGEIFNMGVQRAHAFQFLTAMA